MDAIMDRLGRNSLMTIACRTPHAGSFTAQQNDPVTSHECAALWSLNCFRQQNVHKGVIHEDGIVLPTPLQISDITRGGGFR
jgi:hypothetical protein